MMANNSVLRVEPAPTLACDRGFGKAKDFKKMCRFDLEEDREVARRLPMPVCAAWRQPLSTNTVDKVVHTRRKARVSESRKRIFSFLMKT
jgi:hypothetical protein